MQWSFALWKIVYTDKKMSTILKFHSLHYLFVTFRAILIEIDLILGYSIEAVGMMRKRDMLNTFFVCVPR